MLLKVTLSVWPCPISSVAGIKRVPGLDSNLCFLLGNLSHVCFPSGDEDFLQGLGEFLDWESYRADLWYLVFFKNLTIVIMPSFLICQNQHFRWVNLAAFMFFVLIVCLWRTSGFMWRIWLLCRVFWGFRLQWSMKVISCWGRGCSVLCAPCQLTERAVEYQPNLAQALGVRIDRRSKLWSVTFVARSKSLTDQNM